VSGADAACTPLRRGLITAEMIKSGVIRATMQFSYPSPGFTLHPRFPATETDGRDHSGKHMVEGSWVRLDPKVNLAKLHLARYERIIATAMQRYGMILRDTGGCIGLYGRNTINEGMKWSQAGVKGTYEMGFGEKKSRFPWHRLQVLRPPPH